MSPASFILFLVPDDEETITRNGHPLCYPRGLEGYFRDPGIWPKYSAEFGKQLLLPGKWDSPKFGHRMRESLGILVRNGQECGIGTLFPDPMLRHCGIFIDEFRNITFLAIPWIIELKILCAPSSQQICGLRFVFLINQDIPGATKETKQVMPSQHGKGT